MRALPAMLLCALACGGGTGNTGLSAWLRIPGARFISGAPPAASGGPAVLQATVSRRDIAPGLQDRSLTAVLDAQASGVLVNLDGDAGYWVLPSGPPNPQQPDTLQVMTPIDFSPALPAGQFQLLVRAVSASGAVGTPVNIALQTQDPASPLAALAFTLSWDTEADLDLHVVDAAGNEIFWNVIAADGGRLDFDSNQSCIIDGRRQERVAWVSAPPAGHYRALVDTPSFCSAATAHWTLRAERDGAAVAGAQGQATAFDTRGTHARGAGLLVLELDVP